MGVRVPPSAPSFQLYDTLSQVIHPVFLIHLMKKYIAIVLILYAVLLISSSVQAELQQKGSIGIVSAPLANVHKEPLPKSRLETQVLMGDEVGIIDKQDNHYRISIPSQGNLEGWIQQEAVSIPRDKGEHYLNTKRKWIVISAAKADALILDKTGNHKVPLFAGTRLPVLEQTQNGLKVLFPDRSVAIIDATDTIPEKSSDPAVNPTRAEEIVSTAQRFLGVRFLAGGTTAQGIDGKGLISVVYRIHGFPSANGRGEPNEKGKRVSKKDLEPADILIFSGDQEGMYLGNERFMLVPRKGKVQIAGIRDRRYANAFHYGIRIIDAGPDESKQPYQMTADEILLAQARVAQLPLNKRIAYWAARFIGTPYDPDPLGLYVRTNRIVADEKIDCMYHAFRSVELARSTTPRQAIEEALTLRFTTKGKLADGLVTNYDMRYQYGEDMVFSDKWGKNITAVLGTVETIPGSRGRDTVDILPKKVLLTRSVQTQLQDGDILYWVKDPKKRSVEEIVAHLSIVHIKNGKTYLIHAAGDKDHAGRPGGGIVKEVSFEDYVRHMKFIGAFVTRFDQ
jgi:cell wall-associated NlpC family hydrolase